MKGMNWFMVPGKDIAVESDLPANENIQSFINLDKITDIQFEELGREVTLFYEDGTRMMVGGNSYQRLKDVMMAFWMDAESCGSLNG